MTLPFIPGHELAGEVVETGVGVTGWKPGDHVVAAIDITCGVCRFCRTGRGNLCRSLKRIGFERNGSHAQFAAVPADNLFLVDKSLPFPKAAVIPDAVSCMYHAVKNQGQVRAGDRVLILGIGGLGLQGVQIAKFFGAEVFCTSRQDEKLKIAKEFGADHAINTKTTIYTKKSRKKQKRLCVVVFATRHFHFVAQALSVCRHGGKVVMRYIDSDFTRISDFKLNEKEIIGSSFQPQIFGEAIALWKRKDRSALS